MITTGFLYLIYGVVYAASYPIRLFNDVVAPQGLTDAISTIGAYIGPLSGYLPIAAIMIVLGLVLSAESTIFAYKAIMWLVRRFPTQS